MSLDVTGILNAVESHAMAAGLFESVNGHEPKSPLPSGLHCAVWVQSISPVPAGSGLAATTGRVELTVRVYQPMLLDPQDAIDPLVLGAVDLLMGVYSADFELGGQVRNVDLLGQAGPPLSAQAGYLTVGNTLHRVMSITLPLIVNDLWTQAP